jgi:hypothetical protein
VRWSVENTVSSSTQPSQPHSTIQGGPSAPPVLPAKNINEPPTDRLKVSPVESVSEPAPRTGSIVGGYLPSVPTVPLVYTLTEQMALRSSNFSHVGYRVGRTKKRGGAAASLLQVTEQSLAWNRPSNAQVNSVCARFLFAVPLPSSPLQTDQSCSPFRYLRSTLSLQ